MSNINKFISLRVPLKYFDPIYVLHVLSGVSVLLFCLFVI